MLGRVRHWNGERHFGKITGADRREYFAHVEALLDVLSLTPGQLVAFEPTESARGPRATDVRVVAEARPPRRLVAAGRI